VAKNGRLGPFLQAGLSDYAVTKISQYVWWGSLRRYGEKVHKLTLHGGFSCPNRDGTIGRGGCTFCNVASFADEEQQHRSIAEQLAHQAQRVNRAKRYLAYFQAYTSTFAEVQVLRSMYQQAVSQANIVGLCVGLARTASRRRCWIC
jgi:radical SAM protein (TIGR01212 family)